MDHNAARGEEIMKAERQNEPLYDARVELSQTLWGLQRLYWAASYGNDHVPVRRDSHAVAGNFPDISNISLHSPAFLDPTTVSIGFKEGTEAPTSSKAIDRFMQLLAHRHDWATYHVTVFKSEEGRGFSYLYLSTSFITASGTASDRLRAWIQSSVHGNEPAGVQGVMALLGRMDIDPAWTADILRRMDIMIVPNYNPDGSARFQRNFAESLDPNRDHLKLATQQTRDLKALFNSFAPHIAIDAHEFSAARTYGGIYRYASDALFSTAKNLNIHPDIRDISESLFVPCIGRGLEKRGIRWAPYVTGNPSKVPGSSILLKEASSDAKIGRNAMGLTQCIAFLLETRGIGLADQHFQRRTAAIFTMLESILQVAADDVNQVYTVMERAVEKFVSGKDEIVVTDEATSKNSTFDMIDSTAGSIVSIPVRLASTTPVIAILTRPRPEAYLVPYGWTDVVDRLKASGLEIKSLSYIYRGTVQTYRINSVSFGDTYYEGIVPVTVTSDLVEQEVELPVGSYLISTRQRNAALAFIALEPENIDSYVSFNIIPVETGNGYPVYRIPS